MAAPIIVDTSRGEANRLVSNTLAKIAAFREIGANPLKKRKQYHNTSQLIFCKREGDRD
jgi:hypothetical protein